MPRVPGSLGLILWLEFCTGCGREQAAQRAVPSSSNSAPLTSTAAPVPSTTTASDPELERVKAAFEDWRAAQEALDFDRYAALYAESFRGLKRVGARTFRFDRKHFLEDRRAMFKPGLSVKVSNVELVRVDGRVAVFFTQEFASASYRDRGRKVLVFSPSQRIVREEMLSSEVLGGGGSVAALPGFFFARPDAVVIRSGVEERWLTPARLELARAFRAAADDPERKAWPDEDFLTLRDLQLPPEVSALQGKRFYVTRAPAQGESSLPPPCEVTLTRVGVANTGTEIFESTRGARGLDHLYGSILIGHTDRHCEGALWASESPPGPQFLPVKAKPALSDAALAELRRLPQAQKPGSDPAEEDVQVRVFGDDAGRRLVFAQLARNLWSDSFASVSALFEVPEGSSRPRSLGVLATDRYFTPILAFDADRDHQLEILARESDDDDSWHVLQVHQGRVTSTRVYFSPNFVCPG